MADDTRPHEAPGQGREEHDASLVALTQQVHATSLAAAEAPAPGKIRGGGSSIAEQDDDDDASHDSGHSPPQSSSQDTHHGHARQHHVFTPTTVATTTTTPSSGSVAPASSQATSSTATHQQPLPTPTATSSSGIGSPAPNHQAPEAQPTGAPPHFVAPSSYLRPVSRAAATAAAPPTASSSQAVGSPTGSSRPGTERARNQMLSPLDREQIEGLRAIRAFLKVRTSYDVLPLSYRLIVFDTSLLVKKSLSILTQQGAVRSDDSTNIGYGFLTDNTTGIVSAPLWDSKTSTFAGLLTTSDYINVVQYYWQNPDALAQVDQFKLNSLREIERAIGVTPIETVSIHPSRPLYEACRRMLESRARRIPLVDVDDETRREMVVSVITQYRILKFVSVNVKETQWLKKPLRDINIGTFTDVATAHMDTPVMDVIHQLVKRNISCVPILDRDGTVLNVFEAVDVIALIKGGDYDNLNLSVGKSLAMRSEDFPGIYTCTLNDRLDTVFDTIRKSRVHRLVVIDEASQLKGLLSLSDILDYTLNSPLGDQDEQ
ncbi:AMP-activated serine/threonine-protein kinase regulatory subunit [Friedmanniomyces endolithicus]|uniref:AMP-activated serine/threonine-protein kinase regulatory subunit n=1 Tax=Friedmanniomyces endolithicus TaxID=329885 RepID=A0AAN6FRR3_9PEZI|nr:AMP-activated serine/threonine-protein kinase regulatory subunit [Friedmanniomyces endolithicus]KAK0292805.1 AMP-activated serine/threonine-protein kinase regulatory subunit [Friedmanniomyces endolithicus]KAK0323316.1 AMP-activated serine/threonine-protein kinase regulatory subunit [Friedmanniomyces endolithicus]KAK1013546.1 AMP-activated serine/threonine-protein kinase regulatory subunit [Friedmanniomyces endolithicus]